MPAVLAGWAADALAGDWGPYRLPSEVLAAVTGLDREQTAQQVCWDCAVVKGNDTAPISPITFLTLMDVLAWDRGKARLMNFLHERCSIERTET